MKLKFFGTLFFSLLSLLIFAFPNETAKNLSAKVTAPFRQNGSYTVRFKASAGTAMKSLEGILMVSGDKYRVETVDNTLFSDGENRYNYIPKNKEIYIEKINVGSSSVMESPQRLLTVSGSDNAVVENVSGGITALKYPDYGITLYVRGDHSISKIEVLDENRKSVTIEILSVEFKSILNPKLFLFDSYNYKDSEIIDLR